MIVFFMDYGNSGLVMPVDIYYGIEYDGSICIFPKEEKCDEAYLLLCSLLKNKIVEMTKEQSSFAPNDFQKQYKLQKNHAKVMNIIEKNDKK